MTIHVHDDSMTGVTVTAPEGEPYWFASTDDAMLFVSTTWPDATVNATGNLAARWDAALGPAAERALRNDGASS